MTKVQFLAGAMMGFLLIANASGPTLGPTPPLIQWIPGGLTLRIKQPGREADHAPPSSAEVKDVWSYISTPPLRLRGTVLN
jgi:hypothetical protein